MRSPAKFLSVTLTLFLGVAAVAQQVPDSLNLVPNGSFEEVTGKLRRLGSIAMADGWSSPTSANADLYSATLDSRSAAHAPENANGYQMALSGDNYAGVVWYSFMGKTPRSYLQVKLKRTLKKGQRYCVSYYVSLGEASRYSSDQLGAYLSRMKVSRDNDATLTYAPQVPHLMTKVYDDREGWQGVCGVYEANGDEQYLLIGNFATNDKVQAAKLPKPKGDDRPQKSVAYFYIDDVSVTPVKLVSQCTCEQVQADDNEFIYGRKVASAIGAKPADVVDRSVVYFKRYNARIDPSMKTQMDTLATLLKANPTIRVQLTGHMDKKESEATRMRPDLSALDRERAEAVKAYLVDAGVSATRIGVAGKKAYNAAAEGKDEVSMAQNRRVEVDVVQ